MGTVIKFPRVSGIEGFGRREAPARPAGVSADIIILPVVRIERMLETPLANKARAAKSVAKPPAESASTKAGASRKRRKRTAPVLPAPACGRG
jgi:hypothetical protein